MSDLDRYLTDEVVEAAAQALQAAGLADADGHGCMLENVYAGGAAYVALEAVLPEIIRRAKEEAWEEALQARAAWMQNQRYYVEDEVPNPYHIKESDDD